MEHIERGKETIAAIEKGKETIYNYWQEYLSEKKDYKNELEL